MRNKLAKWLFILGLVLVSTVLIGKLYRSNIEKKTLKDFEAKFNYSEEEKKNALEEIKNGDGIALIDIEKIDVHTVIAEGSTLDVLENNIGHFENTAMPGEEGNFSIAGHRNTINNEVFRNIDRLENGDKIKITTLTDVFQYEVNDIFITSPSDIDVLNQDLNEKTMTIVTCTNRGKDRYIVKGKLID
ncbi:class D sortase [Clostridium perfringens]|nr:class D sortase [Clostridium perfringens]